MIIVPASSSSSELFWVTTLILLGGYGRVGVNFATDFMWVDSPYPLLSLDFVDGDDLIIDSTLYNQFLRRGGSCD